MGTTEIIFLICGIIMFAISSEYKRWCREGEHDAIDEMRKRDKAKGFIKHLIKGDKRDKDESR